MKDEPNHVPGLLNIIQYSLALIKETSRRRLTVSSSLKEISTDQLGNSVGVNQLANSYHRAIFFTFSSVVSPYAV